MFLVYFLVYIVSLTFVQPFGVLIASLVFKVTIKFLFVGSVVRIDKVAVGAVLSIVNVIVWLLNAASTAVTV